MSSTSAEPQRSPCPRQRFRAILFKWAILAVVVLVLWFTQVFHILFWLLLLLIREVNKGLVWIGEPTQQGFDAYWAEYWTYWLVFYVVLFIVTAVWYWGYWKYKRPDLMVGGVRDGRVLWIKGFRRGLIYDWWDVKNYLRGPGSPFGRGWRTRGSRSPTANGPGTLQDPLKIPVGRGTIRRIIYFSRPWSLKVQRLFIQENTQMVVRYSRVSIPAGNIINVEDPKLPGARVLIWVHKQPGFQEYDANMPQKALEGQLVTAKANVKGSVAANPSIIQNEYMEGSLGKV